jgi:enterobacteria phage integrase
MRRKLPPFVECWRDRHGKIRVYFRRGKSARIPLPSVIGSAEFNAAYQAALTDVPAPKLGVVHDQTIAALIVSYQASLGYARLRPTSKRSYRPRLEALRNVHGHRPVAGLTVERIEKMLLPYADRPGAALALILRWLDHDPTLGLEKPKISEVRSWTDREIAVYEARWPIGTKQRLALALHLYTGQRRSDVHRMTWADIGEGTIRVVQQKTGRKLDLALHRALREVLAGTRREHVTILVTEYSKPFTVGGFSRFMRRAITAAGLPLDCQPHGLRKAAGRRLAEAGCTPHEIMAVLGHKTLGEAERYTREADQGRLSSAAVAKLEGRSGNTIPQTGSRGLGMKSKTGVKARDY